MAKKSMKAAATAGTSVFDQLVQGTQDAENVTDVQDVQNVQNAPATRPGRPAKTTQPLERLNLKIPADIKEYLQAAAYRESSPKKTVSLTECVGDVGRADMGKHKDE